MSLINNANPGSQIDLMSIVFRVLHRAPAPMTEEKLIALCRPETLPIKDDQRKRLPGELQFWADPAHQLWSKDETGAYSLVHPLPGDAPTPLDIASVVSPLLMGTDIATVFDPSHDADGVAQLMAMLSCVLAVPDFSAFSDQTINKENLDELQGKYLPPESRLNASNEISEAIAYGHFLGFFEPADKGGYVVDPTEAVTRVLKDAFEPGEVVGMRDCLATVAEKIPVIDGGKFREEVEAKMAERGFRPPPQDRLSRTLSHALYRLRIAGVIKLEELSDDPRQLRFDLPIGEKKFSQVKVLATEG